MSRKLLYTVGGIASSALVAWSVKSSQQSHEELVVGGALCEASKNEIKIDKNNLENAINKARDIVLRVKDEVGAPGIVIGVSIDGKTVWKEGIGFANVETRSPCHADTVMRIASISKSMTMALVAKMWEEGKLDLDAPIQKYVPYFPNKTHDGKPVEITTRMLISHLSGIRHYVKKGEKPEPELRDPIEPRNDNKTPPSTTRKEVYNKEKFDSVEQAISMFKDDELLFKPGSQYLYTTHGWTLVSAVLEGAAKEPFVKQARKLFVQLGLHSTRLDEFEPIIYNRASYYRTLKTGRMVNVPFTDTSYKWAGGGFLSSVGDLLKFAHAMLYSYQWKPGMVVKDGKIIENIITNEPSHPIPDLPPGYLKPDTVKTMWTTVPLAKSPANGTRYRDDRYGMGWQVAPYRAEYGTTGGGDVQLLHVSHGGAAVGASSILFILPAEQGKKSNKPPPRGVCVAIITNMQNVGLGITAHEIAHLFAGIEE